MPPHRDVDADQSRWKVVFVVTDLALSCQSDVPRGRVGSDNDATFVVVVCKWS